MSRAHHTWRCFASSTFVDMIAERDALQRVVFPEITRLCRADGHSFAVGDLRWGIRPQEIERNNLVSLCLVAACRSDVFIGLLGQRYGHTPPPAAHARGARDFPWIRQFSDRSLTELEIRAAFDAAEQSRGPTRFIFGFRSPAWRFTNDDVRLLFPPAVRDFEPGDFADTDPAAIAKLAALKDYVQSRDCVRFEYADADECAAILLQELTKSVPGKCPIQLHRNDDVDTETYVSNRRAETVVSRFVRGKPQRLVLVGESGCGKSALVQHLLRNNSNSRKPCRTVVVDAAKFAGLDAPWNAFLSEMLLELTGDDSALTPDLSDKWLPAAISSRLCQPQHDPVCLIIDGLNELDLAPLVHGLAWLPELLPTNLRVLFTLGTDPASMKWLDELQRHGFERAQFPEMSNKEALAVATQYLRQSDKNAWPSIDALIQKSRLSNPRMIRTLIDGLSREVFETVDSAVDDYGDFSELSKLIGRCWARMVHDLEKPRRRSEIRRLLHFLSFHPRGLHVEDAQNLMGQDGPGSDWRFARIHLDSFLLERESVIRLSSTAALDAATMHLRPTPEEFTSHVAVFQDYFLDQPQLPLLRRWDALFALGNRLGRWEAALALAAAPDSLSLLVNARKGELLHAYRSSGVTNALDSEQFVAEARVNVELASAIGELYVELGNYDALPPVFACLDSDIRGLKRSAALSRLLAARLIEDGSFETARLRLTASTSADLGEVHYIETFRLLASVELQLGNNGQAMELLAGHLALVNHYAPAITERHWNALLALRTSVRGPHARVRELQRLIREFQAQGAVEGTIAGQLQLTRDLQTVGAFSESGSLLFSLHQYATETLNTRLVRNVILARIELCCLMDADFDVAAGLVNEFEAIQSLLPACSMRTKATFAKLCRLVSDRVGVPLGP